MAIKIPDELKSDIPQTFWGKVLTSTPIVMTVVATALAGLASSEMTRAMYKRSLAAQQQSQAGAQWGYFQAKRLRSALTRNSLDLLRAAAPLRPVDEPTLEPAAQAALKDGRLPELPAAAAVDPAVKTALDEAATGKTDIELAVVILPVKDETFAAALRAAQDRVRAYDVATTPINRALDAVESKTESRDVIAACLRYSVARYDAEAKLNQAVAQIYELQVRKSNLVSDRHHRRSQKFFYGMLAAQAAVIISTFAMAARKRGLLWGVAATAGTLAVSFGVYVYLFV
jgi:hypothetical protein